MLFSFFSIIQLFAGGSDGSVKLNHTNVGSGRHNLSLQTARMSEPGGSAAL